MVNFERGSLKNHFPSSKAYGLEANKILTSKVPQPLTISILARESQTINH